MLKMEKNVNKFRKILVAIMLIIMALSVCIKVDAIDLEQGTMNPIYRPKWELVSSSLNIDASNLKDSTINIVLRGTASHSETIDSNVSIDYSSTVTGNLTKDDITVYINNTRADWITKTLTLPADTTEVNSVTYTLTLSGFEENERQLGVPYKDWSGNIKIRIGGRGEAPETYDANKLVDKYGNQSMMATDETGTWIDVTYKDPDTDHNTNGTMFVDFVRPEFTYKHSNTTIVGGDVEKVTLVFDVTDQYFESSILTADLITVKVADEVVDSTVGVTKTLTKIKDVYYDKTAGTSYVNTGAAGTGAKVGERYQLEITGLDKGDAFKYSGYMTLEFQAGVKDASTGTLTSGIIDKSGNLNPGTTITIGIDEPGEILPSTEYTKPYLPSGYTYITGTDLSNGLTIQDKLGNQYVWVEVPTNIYDNASYNTETTTADRKPASNTDYDDIEYCLHKYTATYRKLGHTDTFYSTAQHGFADATAYNNHKNKMLKSVYENGGFYVGKYETGIADTEPDVVDTNHEARRASGSATQTPVIQANAYPYNFVTNKQAQELASGMASGGYTSSLLFGVQWDLILKHLETKEFATESELKSNSTEWGNYTNNTTYTTNANGKYALTTGSYAWEDGGYNKTASGSVLLSTGASSEFERGGIYDLAGNVWEWTLEYTSNTDNPCALRGGYCNNIGDYCPASYRGVSNTTGAIRDHGFRVALYRDEDATEQGTIVDVVDPIWKVNNIEITENPSNLKNSTVTLELTATDKYYLSNIFEEARAAGTLEEALKNMILLYIDGVLDGDTDGDGILEEGETPTVTKTLSTATNLTPAGTGVKYTLTFSNWDAEKYSGTARFKIPAGTITDQIIEGRNNESNEQEFIIGHIDFTKPVITKVSSENIDTDADGKDDAVQIIFKATDKFMVMDDLITIPTAANPSARDEITVYVDNEVATGITRTLTNEEITEVVNGVTVKGHQYTLVLSNFEQTRTTINRAREFSDWSGTVRIDIKQGAVRDEEVTNANGEVSGGNVNDETPITGEFADFIKPNVTYEYSSTDIVRNHADKTQRTFTMVFDVTDKYFTSSAFATAFAAATTDAQKLAVLQEYLTIWIDDVDITRVDTVTKKIVGIENVTATMNKTTDIANKTITNNVSNAVIGKRFTLEISNLEQEPDITQGYDYLDYSGVITVGFNTSKPLATDSSSNSNLAGSITVPSITSGVTTPDGSGSEVIVDLVDPIWEQGGNSEARPYEKYAKIPVKGTDKYIQTNNLQPSDIKITVTTPRGTITVDNGADANGTTDFDESEDVEQKLNLTVTQDTSVTLAYGKQYNIVLTGYATDAYQVKLTLRDGILSDTSGNTSQETSFILFTSLVETSTETSETSEFLAKNKESGQVIPQRQYVEQVILQSNLTGINSTKWDVSQLNDGTVWAWYTTRTAEDGTTLYTVYIGSYIIMNGNVNSSYLFANLGYNQNCKVTGDTPGNEFIKNLYMLQTSSITNMSHMFDGCGYANMQSLDLGTAFNTMSVTDMSYMFQNCGYTSMETFDLGDKFDTSKVTNMRHMFRAFGYTAMTSLDLSAGTGLTNTTQFNTSSVEDMFCMFHECGFTAMTGLNLGNNFNTIKVTDMYGMFHDCGLKALTSLDLKDKFDTSSVTRMQNMFNGCGTEKMVSLDLGDKFDTSKVTNMRSMFHECGMNKMTSLDLGDLFYTTSAENMYAMFAKCGNAAMTILDLGPAFTKIPSGTMTENGNQVSVNTGFIYNTGRLGECVIYAPEAIYNSMTQFKLNANSETTIEYTLGTINPIYKPEWEKVSSTLDKGAGKLTVVVKGYANKTFTNGTYTGTYKSDVTSALTANQVTVYVDGELAEGIDASDITVSTASTSTNATTGKTEVQYTITISNFEQAVRFAGKNFKEWSGNVELQLAKGTLIDTWGSYIGTDAESNPIVVKDVSKDASGNIIANQNLAVIDIDTSGTTENIVVEDATKITANTETTEANMFVDLIKPEYTYTYSTTNPDINTGVESVTVVFDVTDKYFESTALASDSTGSLITVTVDGDENANTPITKVLTKIKDVYYDGTAGINYVNPGTAGTGRRVGERYQLVITGLDREDGFTYSGPMTLTFAAGAEDADGNLTAGIRDNSGNLSSLTAIAMGVNEPDMGGTELPETAYTKPYLPAGYNHIPGTDLSNGLTIQDWLGNQYVWVEVPTNLYDNSSYNTETTTGDRKPDSNEDYDDIEYCLHKYTATYRGGTGHKDIHSGNDDLTGLTSAEYTELKQKMLKSVYENGGFYVGKYETGIADTQPDVIDTNHEARTAEGPATQTPVIQANAYPYNYVTTAQAQTLASGMASGGYTSSLLFGVQWDLVLKHLETKEFATVSELNLDSTEWGNNYNNTTYSTNANAKYATDSNSYAWTDGAYNKTTGESVLLSTGASTEFERGGIYDLAGNVREITLEFAFDPSKPFVIRGGICKGSGSVYPASCHVDNLMTSHTDAYGFRVALYKDEDAHSDEPIIVDVVDPIWEVRNAAGQVGQVDKTVDANGNVTVSMTLIGKDKYFKQSTLTKNDIKIKVDGIEDISVDANGDGATDNAPDLVKTLSTPVYIKLDGSGNYVETTSTDPDVIGVKYQFSMSGLKESDEIFFANRANYNTDATTGRPYREYSGEMSIVIPADKLEDQTGNKNNLFTIPLNHVDTLKPEVIKVSSQANINATNRELSTHTIVFDIVDKYMNSSSITATDTSMIHIYLDGEEAASITKPATTAEQNANVDKIFKEITNIQTLRDDIDKDGTVETDEIVGYRYTLVLSGLEKPRTSINYDREYTDWSGDLSIKIDANTATDTVGNANNETILYGNEDETTDKTKADHVDYVKPDATYEYSSVQDGVSDVVDKNGKTYEMTFDITDKFFQTDGLSISDFSILMSAEEETGEGEDRYYDIMANTQIDKALEAVDITNDVVVDIVNGEEVKETKVIGKRYTVRLSNLEKLQKIENNHYLDYSGSITITIPAGKVTDTSGNGNDTTAITSGIDIPGGEVTDISQIDVVQPLWERTAFTTDIHNQTATITLLGTDKYFYEYDVAPGAEGYDADLANKGTLTLEEIGLYINGIATTGTISEGVKTLTDAVGNVIGKLTIESETKLYEERLVQTEYGDGDVDTGYSTERVQYGVRYELKITDLAITAEQIKIHLPEGSLIDQSANPNRLTEFFVYNTLRKAQDASGNWEKSKTSGFLSNSTIQRQNIEKIEFVDSLDAAPTIGTESAEGVILCWDVSAVRDNSILAWATQTETQATKGVYTVYIGSDDDIYGNIDSSYLFSYIGYSTNCTATDTISGIGLLDTRNITNMSNMFLNCGYAKMSSLDLGNNFDTSNVTDMGYMFQECGYTAMTSLDLGTKFDTSKVTKTNQMFGKCGYTAMTSLDLGTKFDTSNVTNMKNMFRECGYMKMTVLNLGTNFNTSNVTDMYGMFYQTGHEAMTALNLGTKFDTSNVIDMGHMFRECGYKAMTSLDLSSGTDEENTTQFNTSNVVEMMYMFLGCGYTKMTTLNLGNNFDTSRVTNMMQMFQQCGKTAMTSLDLGDKFYTTNVTNMYGMFANCTALTILDLGPAFTKIPDGITLVAGTEFNANEKMFNGFVNSSTIIYAPESIYANKNSFKLNTTATEGIVSSGDGTINPIYKPEWEKVSSAITVDNTNLENSKIEITIKGSANKTFTNGTYTGEYASEIASLITAGNDASNKILVKVDGEIDGDTDRDGILETGETPTITKTVEVISQSATEVKYKITLSGFEQALRQTGADKNFLEWSGNIAIQPIKGTLVDKYGSYLTTEKQTVIVSDYNANPKEVEVYVPATGVFTDASGNYIGNKNMISIDDADGNWLDVEIRDASQDAETGYWTDLEDNNTEASTNGTMFTDFIKPEFTYVYSTSNPNIQGDPNNRVTIVFDVTDKYFASTSLATNTNGSLITVTVDSDEDVNSTITKTLSKVEDLYYTVNGVTTHKVGERYQLVIEGLESSDGIGYSGPLTLSFPQDVITDLSGNKSEQAAITMGVNEPGGDEDDQIVVDVVNPVWSYADSEIDRENNEVNIYIIGSDKYYYTDVFKAYITDMADGTLNDTTLLDDIIVHVDNSSTTVDTNRDGEPDANVSSITKTLTDITDEMKSAGNEERLAELIAGAGLTDKMTADNNLTKVGVIYKLTLSTFGTISGETKVVINPGTIEDVSGNKNTITTINVGNVKWIEADVNRDGPDDDNDDTPEIDENLSRTDLKYTAFRGNVVDFIKPIITYEYSTVMIDTNGDGTADTAVSANPDIDYDQKEVTVKFKVTDKYLLGSDLIKTTTDAQGNTIQVPKNISISVDGTKVYDGNLETQPYEVTATISETAIDNGKEYTLVISNLQQTNTSQPTDTTPENGDGFKFSGPMTIDFVGNVIDDTSGNKNDATSITLDTHVNPDVVDVVDPIIYKTSSSIDRTAKTVTVNLKAEDKYLNQQVLTANQNLVKVRVEDEYGNIIVEDTTTIRKNITQTYFNTGNGQVNFSVVLDNFGIYEGKTTIIIPPNMILDTSGNGNVETEILVGSSSDTTAFKDHIVDFTKPTWEYVTSSIERDFDASNRRLENGELGTRNPDGTVTIEVKGTDIYFDKPTYFDNADNQLNLNNVVVYVNGVAKDDVEVDYATNPDGSIVKEYIEETKELATGYSRVFKGVKYKLILSNFGTYDGQVKIDIPVNAIKDTSTLGNIVTPIDVGNENWLEIEGEKYTAFRNDYVDFIKPIITYKYEENVNPKLIRTTDAGGNPVEKVQIQFTTTDTNFLESNIGLEDIKVFIDDDYEMQVYGTGADAGTAITAELDQEDLPVDEGNGIKYTLTLSGLELDRYINSEIFERHSGRIKLIIAADQVYDTSGNPNNETTIIVDNDDGDDASNIEVVDFVSPNIYYQDKYINWNDRYAVITLRATDRYFDDEDSNLQPSDIGLYENNVQITDFAGKIVINKTPLTDAFGNMLGYDYIIRLNEFTEEFKLEVRIPGMKLYDTSGNYNDPTNIFIDLDNRKPTWEYVSTDTSGFEPENGGTISFNVKGVDKFLDIANSNLDVADLQVLLDGEVFLDGSDETDAEKITVNYLGADENEKSKSYKIDVTGLTEVGVYTLVFADGTLIDTYNNESAATTITFSKAVIAPNTGNYVNVTYHISPDHETVHSSYVHELMSVNTNGTNSGSATYRPSTLGELYNNGANPLFKEPMYKPTVGADGYTMSDVYSPVSFAGWEGLETDSNGNIKYYTDSSLTTVSATETAYTKKVVYGLYDEISNKVTDLKAVWQDATVIFVSASTGDDANDGSVSAADDEIKPVKTLARAYELLSATGTSTNNIIVIMDAAEWDSTATLTGNATITSLYAGVDYRATGAELKISSNMTVNGDIIFDNIELYTSSSTVSDGTDYLGNGTYTNMLISNYSGDITLGRGITTTATGSYTFGAIIGGNYKTETSDQATHTIRVEAGKYNNIIAGSTLTNSTLTRSATHNIVIGNMRDTAISRNSNLTITGYLAMGENEFKCYPTGVTTTANAASQDYSVVTVYSGTFTGVNKFTKATENSSIYLRSINGETDGKMKFEMFGGQVTGNIYGGASSTSYTSDIYNTMKFYGGKVIGDIFGQSANDIFNGGSNITFQGIFAMNGNIFGGSNVTTTVTDSTIVGTGASTITIENISIITGGSINVYGGSKSTAGYMEGNVTTTLNSGNVTNIYGGGYGSGVQGTTNITIENGLVNGNVFGGGQNGEARTVSNITVLGGTIGGNIYGGNDNSDISKDTISQDVNIIIGDTDATKAPTITGNIYGSGQKDNVDKVIIELIEAADTTTVFGGSDENAVTATAEIYLKGMTVDNIYGGGQSAGTVETANIYLQAGTATDVYGGGYAANVTNSNITLQGTTIGTEDVTATVGSIYGGSNNGGTVTTSNVTLKSGNVTNVFGGGSSAAVGTANVTLDGITINTIHGGSKDAGVTTTTNVTLLSGTVETVFGGGLDVGVGTSNVSHESSANVTNIYGGNNSGSGTGGDTTTSNVKISSNVTNVYGGNYLKGTTTTANVTIHGSPTISGKLFAGGYKSNIGKAEAEGSTTIKVVGGTINNDINGGSEEGIVYGTTNMYIGVDSFIDATLTAGNVEIKGTIYGAGSSANSGYTTSSVIGNTNITMDNSSIYPVIYSGSIFGSGKNSTYSTSGTASDESTIHIKDFGTSVDNTYQFVSIERTGSLYIGKSFIELTGRQDEYNFYKRKSYTLNRITKGLTIYDNTTLFNRRGFNMVGGFNSYRTLGGAKATMMNVQNRLYTFEGINLIFAKQEGDIYASPTQDIWGDVNGMTFFGMYAIDRDNPTKKVLDIYAPDFDGDAEKDFFANGTYVEGRHKESHSLTLDGFYTNIADYTDLDNITVTQQVIDATDYGKYYDWIVGAEIVNYETTLIGSTYGKESIAEILLDYQYENGATYTLNRVSLNPLNTGINLINSDLIPTVSANANNTFGLTMETDRTGWLSSSFTNIYTASEGSFDGDTTYASDTSAGAGKIIFRLNNSINITEKKDLGNVDLILTGRTPERADGTGANTFIVVIAVNIQTIVDEIGNKYEPSFTGKTETELSYTTDSKVDLTYMLYNTVDTMPYTAGDYKVISSTVRFPAGTRITMKDYGQGDSLNKVYYYHVPNTTPATETKDGATRYIYELSDFIEMGSKDATYADIEAIIADTNNTPYYHAGDRYVYEKYDISIDFIDSNIAQTLANETYLELRNSSGALKYDNDETTIKYNLYLYSSEDPIYRAQFAETISNEGSSYSIVESLEIPLTISGSLLEQSGIMDTKYDDQIVGIAIQIVGESGIRIKSPELQNFKLTNVDTGEVYEADTNGVIRMPIIEGFGTKSANYKLSMEQSDVAPGVYTAQVRLYTADDGKYYGTEPAVEKTFSITFISKLAGLVGAEATDDSRIINATTGLNLEEGSTANKAVDMTVGVANPSSQTNIRVELYKRNPTYTDITNEESYTGTSYTLVDIADYLRDLEATQDTDATDDSEDALDTWVTPSTYGLTAANQYEYMVMNKKTYPTLHDIITIEFEKAIMSGIDTGEYKLVFKAYSNDTLVGTVKKTFIVTP